MGESRSWSDLLIQSTGGLFAPQWGSSVGWFIGGAIFLSLLPRSKRLVEDSECEFLVCGYGGVRQRLSPDLIEYAHKTLEKGACHLSASLVMMSSKIL